MDANKHFDTLSKRFFHEWVKRNPILGSSLGYHEEYDELMPDGTYDREIADHAFFRHWIEEFTKQDPKKLRDELAVDREFALTLLKQWLHERSELQLWNRCPETALTVGHSLYQILSRNYAPLKDRMKRLTKRMDALPKYIEQSKERLKVPLKYYVENELEALTRLPGFFNTVRDISREHLSAAFERQMHKLIESAQNALEKYSDWLIVDMLPECGEEWAIGEPAFRASLVARGIMESPSTLLSMGESEMSRGTEKLKEIGKLIKRKVAVEDIRDIVKAQHADGIDAVLRYVREMIGKAKQFTNRSKFANIPEHDSMYVIETPAFLRHLIPLSGYWPPAKFENKRDGYIFVTPGDCDSDKLKEHNTGALVNLAVHQSYPGRHLMGGWAIHHPSLLRTFASTPETVEGWSFYCEERVKELGFEDTPSSRFMQVLGYMLAAARMILDVKLNTGKMTATQGVEYLIDHIGMDRVAAEGEVRRITVYPTVSASEFLGREKIKEMRKFARDEMKTRYTDLFFHNTLLKSCPLPLKVMRMELAWKIKEELAKPLPKDLEKPKVKKVREPEEAPPKPEKAAKPPKPLKKAAPTKKAPPKKKSKVKAKPKSKPKGKKKKR